MEAGRKSPHPHLEQAARSSPRASRSFAPWQSTRQKITAADMTTAATSPVTDCHAADAALPLGLTGGIKLNRPACVLTPDFCSPTVFSLSADKITTGGGETRDPRGARSRQQLLRLLRIFARYGAVIQHWRTIAARRRPAKLIRGGNRAEMTAASAPDLRLHCRLTILRLDCSPMPALRIAAHATLSGRPVRHQTAAKRNAHQRPRQSDCGACRVLHDPAAHRIK